MNKIETSTEEIQSLIGRMETKAFDSSIKIGTYWFLTNFRERIQNVDSLIEKNGYRPKLGILYLKDENDPAAEDIYFELLGVMNISVNEYTNTLSANFLNGKLYFGATNRNLAEKLDKTVAKINSFDRYIEGLRRAGYSNISLSSQIFWELR